MPMAFDNLTIAQYRDILRYAFIKRVGYRLQLQRLVPDDYIYLQKIVATTLDMIVGKIILQIKKILSSGILELESRNGWIWKDHAKNCIPCHLSNINGSVDPTLSAIFINLKCMLYSRA